MGDSLAGVNAASLVFFTSASGIIRVGYCKLFDRREHLARSDHKCKKPGYKEKDDTTQESMPPDKGFTPRTNPRHKLYCGGYNHHKNIDDPIDPSAQPSKSVPRARMRPCKVDNRSEESQRKVYRL